MQKYTLIRLLQALFTIWAVVTIVFAIARLAGDPATLLLPMDSSKEDLEELRHHLGLDQPMYIQYLVYLKNAMQGNFGISMRWNDPVLPLVFSRLRATMELVALAMLISTSAGLTVGILSAVKRGSLFDRFGKTLALLGQAAPTFWVGLMLILLLAVTLRLLPSAGRGGIQNLIMPAITLGWYSTAAITRLTRSAMLDVLDSEYVKMARSKGVPEVIVILKHALKNAAIPVVTMLGLQISALLYGAVITETIFAWPGMGRLAVDSIVARDFPVIQAVVLVGSSIYVFVNLFVDILYAYLDPRIRYA